MHPILKYIWNILVSIDQLMNSILGGDPDETLSSRASKHQNHWFWGLLNRFLEFVDPGHGDRNREDDEGKDQIL